MVYHVYSELTPLLVTLGLIGGGWLLFSRRHSLSAAAPAGSSSPSSASPAQALTGWRLPAAGVPYAIQIDAAEGRYGLPRGLLGRLLEQESGFSPDVIDGMRKSSAGAVGIAQLIPRYFPDVDATNPAQSIDAAARYLAALHKQFGSWRYALAAYNWGPGHLASWIEAGGSAPWPSETVRYVSDITADIPEAQFA